MSEHSPLDIDKMLFMNRLRIYRHRDLGTKRTPSIAPRGHNNLLAPLPSTEPSGKNGIIREGNAEAASKWVPAQNRFPPHSMFGRVGNREHNRPSGARTTISGISRDGRMLNLPLILRDTPCKTRQNREITGLTQRLFIACVIALCSRTTPHGTTGVANQE